MKARINGVELAFTDQGTGLPVLFVHGYPLNRTMWAPQVSALSSRVRVITVDLRGHGASEAPASSYTVELFADDLRGLLDHLRIDQAVLVGFSMGGYITLAFYRQYRDRVKALVLVDTRPQPDSAEAKAGRRKTADTAKKDGASPIADAMVPKLLSPQTLAGRPDLVQQVRAIILGTPVQGIVGDLMTMAERPDAVPLLSEISCPTLVLVGEQDGLTPPADAQLMADAIRGARLETIPHAGHLTPLEQPDLVNTAIRTFLESIT